MGNALAYAIFQCSNTLLELVLSILFVVFIHFNWQGRVLGFFLAKLFLCSFAIYFIVKYGFLEWHLDYSYLKSIFNYGFPVVLHSLGFVIIAAIDRFFINAFVDVSTTGIYSVSYAVCSLIVFLTSALNTALVPIMYKRLGSATDMFKRKLVKFTYIYFFVVAIGVILFIKFIPFILGIFVGSKFLGARKFIFWLALGFGFHSMYTMVVRYIFYTKKTYILSKIALLTVALSIISNYILVKLNGALGVAQATCLVFFARFLLVWFFSNKVYPLPWLGGLRRV